MPNKSFLMGVLALTTAATSLADPVDLEKAKTIAAEYTPAQYQPTLVKKAVRNEAMARKLPAKMRQTPPYYIFSRGEDQGFVIVSGDDCMPSVLGYTENGNYDESLLPPHFFVWLDHFGDIIEEAQAGGTNLSRTSPARRKAPARVKGWDDIRPLCTTHWNQGWPYNERCPFRDTTNERCLTGCVATAAAQVVYYYHKDNPDTFLQNTPTYPADQWHHNAVTESIERGTPIKWDLMLDSYNGSEPQEYRDAVADLMFAIGAMVHMDYDSSSAAQITDLVSPFNSFFNLTSVCEYKSDGDHSWIALETWEKMLYDDLAQGHPMIYTGYHADQGGHAVVLDGYQSNTGLFHFNFGWGGQGDGWYTVDDETGMNNFRMWQGATYKVTPKKSNLEVKMALPDGFYVNHDNRVRLTVKNLGTLNYSDGIYLFLNSSAAKPSALTSARGKDTETMLPNDGSEVVFDMTLKPTTARTWYVTVTDRNLNVLAQKPMEAGVMNNDLLFNSIRVLGSDQTEQHGGKDYTIVYGERTTCIANLTNQSSLPYQDRPRIEIYTSDDDGATFTLVGEKSIYNATIPALSAADLEFTVNNDSYCPIEQNRLYYAALCNPLSTRSDTNVHYEENVDTVARFILKAPDTPLTGTLDEDGKLRFEGQWSPYNFTSIATETANKNAVAYDLTNVTGIGLVPRLSNQPNALYYVDGSSAATGINVVKPDNTVEQLDITVGYDFLPTETLTAQTAALHINLEPNMWHLVTIPFDAEVPRGIVAKNILEHSRTGFTSYTEIVTSVQAGHTYLLMLSSTQQSTITATNTTVAAAPMQNTDPVVVGLYTAQAIPEGSYQLNSDDTQQFYKPEAGTVAPALTGYVDAANFTAATLRANTNTTIDPSYQKLGQGIAAAYVALGEYQSTTTPEAYELLYQKIQQAEEEFTHRSFESTSSTRALTAQLATDVEVYKGSLRTGLGDIEIDMTQLITNPSFEEGTNGSIQGWTVGDNTAVVRKATDNNYRGVGADGSFLLYSRDSRTDEGTSLSQTIYNVPAGCYRLTAMLGTEPGESVTLFANGLTAETPAHTHGQYYLTEAVIDEIHVTTDNPVLSIGVQAGHWYKADDFRLYFMRSLTLDEDPAVGIQTPVEDFEVRTLNIQRNGIYDLTGRRVAANDAAISTLHLSPGIYIVNGRKVVVK